MLTVSGVVEAVPLACPVTVKENTKVVPATVPGAVNVGVAAVVLDRVTLVPLV
jgi:hypothetical protein